MDGSSPVGLQEWEGQMIMIIDDTWSWSVLVDSVAYSNKSVQTYLHHSSVHAWLGVKWIESSKPFNPPFLSIDNNYRY